MLFVIIGRDARDAREKRPTHRPAHLAHLEPLAKAGRIALAGPLTDGAGSLIVIEAESLEEVWALVGRDPYVTNGIFESVEVHPFLQVFGSAPVRGSAAPMGVAAEVNSAAPSPRRRGAAGAKRGPRTRAT